MFLFPTEFQWGTSADCLTLSSINSWIKLKLGLFMLSWLLNDFSELESLRKPKSRSSPAGRCCRCRQFCRCCGRRLWRWKRRWRETGKKTPFFILFSFEYFPASFKSARWGLCYFLFLGSTFFTTYSQTALLFLQCLLQQVALLGFFCPPPNAAAWFEPTSVELHWVLWGSLYLLIQCAVASY